MVGGGSETHSSAARSKSPIKVQDELECALAGKALLNSPRFNKGSAFTAEERDAFQLNGLLPTAIHTLGQQTKRAYEQYLSYEHPIAKNQFLQSLRDQNEVLFYRLILDHLKEMFSIIYTPTEGDAIEQYSHLFRRPEGCFLDVEHIDTVDEVVGQWAHPDDIDYIVVTDGEEILGIGDQGVGAIGISTAKLALMTLCAGIHPNRTLGVVLDCGTDNEELLNDDLYLGLRQNRVRGEKYDAFVEAFIKAVKKHYPKAFLHFEDFGLTNARRLLEIYRPQLPCFNDDIQGTGAVTLAATMSAIWVSKVELNDIRMLVYGAGSAGTGIADQVRDAMAEIGGVDKEVAKKQIWLVDKPGILTLSLSDSLTNGQKPYARPNEEFSDIERKSLVQVIQKVKPHILIGTSTHKGAFTEDVVREMSKHVERPIIFPLSNPTKLVEGQPEDIYKWSSGKALIATGSPFKPVEFEGNKYVVAECNNAMIYPGIGLGCVLSRANTLSDAMLIAAVHALAAEAPALKDPNQGLLSDVKDVRKMSMKVACAVIKKAVEDRVATASDIPASQEELEAWVEEQMWDPVYRPLKKVHPGTASRDAKGQVGSKSSQ
ncbi:NAD-dependent malic enzyme, mitochondrial [Orbilia oligospora]|uniref:malate dehydrogenase (oxaloacetate-decarboxylating) n=1 Tax=Orbilia oligospora TaxID=2813651 RepID=A0A6G1MP22_ORBOL|nr:NAD-dependent malic enzyme, mitochondrial [Orbilia oligospora]KAF3200062.1 NAD-dependent malic enzyme, mitochondrial [Orbilia oligospora]KAF3265667.1 NAD-dependent malic enzyme, mitochondrial [Orbilia oligospora]